MTLRLLSNLPRATFAVAILFLSSCAANKDYPAGSLILDGVMRKTELEGGCWVFQAKDGKNYELVGTEGRRLMKEGQRAGIVVTPRPDLASICMVGRIVEVLEIVRIY